MELQHEEKIKELRENEKNLLRKEKGKWGDEVEALNKFYEGTQNTHGHVSEFVIHYFYSSYFDVTDQRNWFYQQRKRFVEDYKRPCHCI